MSILTKEQQLTGNGTIESDPPKEQEKVPIHGTPMGLSKKGSQVIMGELLGRTSQ